MFTAHANWTIENTTLIVLTRYRQFGIYKLEWAGTCGSIERLSAREST